MKKVYVSPEVKEVKLRLEDMVMNVTSYVPGYNGDIGYDPNSSMDDGEPYGDSKEDLFNLGDDDDWGFNL